MIEFAIVTFLTAFFGALLFNYPVRAASRRFGFLDYPDERKLHTRAIPYGGGVGLYAALLFAIIVGYIMYPPAFLFRERLMALVLGGGIVVLFGLYDDARGSGALIKFTAQGAVALIMYLFGFRVEKLSIPIFGAISLGMLAPLVTVFWYWLLMNAINLIDGLDGLAAGVCAISAITILLITMGNITPFNMFQCLCIAGICIGFLFHNFYPAKLFMGDAGSLLLGFLIASLTLSTSTKAPAFLTLLIPLLAVGMPVFDTAYAFLRRILKGEHPFRADKKHLHHRLLALGLSQRRSVLILYYISAYLGVMAVVLSKAPPQFTALVVLLLMTGLFLLAENVSALAKIINGKKGK